MRHSSDAVIFGLSASCLLMAGCKALWWRRTSSRRGGVTAGAVPVPEQGVGPGGRRGTFAIGVCIPHRPAAGRRMSLTLGKIAVAARSVERVRHVDVPQGGLTITEGSLAVASNHKGIYCMVYTVPKSNPAGDSPAGLVAERAAS